MPPKAAKMTVPIHGEVLYHPPGWRLLFKRQLSTTIRATDVSGDFAQKLGLGAGVKAMPHLCGDDEAKWVEDYAEAFDGDEISQVATLTRSTGIEAEEQEEEEVRIGFLILNGMKATMQTELGIEIRGCSKLTLIDKLQRREVEEALGRATEAERSLAELQEELAKERGNSQRFGQEQAVQLQEALERERLEREELQRQLELARLENVFAEEERAQQRATNERESQRQQQDEYRRAEEKRRLEAARSAFAQAEAERQAERRRMGLEVEVQWMLSFGGRLEGQECGPANAYSS
ncbi:unnamed protein product [Polarella glacialis]|uniref:Uncharacterized protein n=1 Tax=Polarella glacialis TaxID=89957 RepID=A0A813G6Q3_POLGL|nr:unnamed protein product [Polarella glacialis]